MFTIWKRNAVVITVSGLRVRSGLSQLVLYALGILRRERRWARRHWWTDRTREARWNEADVYADTDLADYFATARLTRQQARDSALALLNETAAADNAAQSVRDEANESIQAMAAYTWRRRRSRTL
jgi:stage III sporulation protein AH